MHWHQDNKAPASKFYPTKGRKGKKMSGKPGRDELLRSRDCKWVEKWMEAFYKVHDRYPSTEEKYEVMRTARVRDEYEFLSGSDAPAVVIDREVETLASGADPVAYLSEAVERQKAEEAAAPAFEAVTATEMSDAVAAGKLRARCPIPMDLFRNHRNGKMRKEVLMAAFELSSEEFDIYFTAMFGS